MYSCRRTDTALLQSQRTKQRRQLTKNHSVQERGEEGEKGKALEGGGARVEGQAQREGEG